MKYSGGVEAPRPQRTNLSSWVSPIPTNSLFTRWTIDIVTLAKCRGYNSALVIIENLSHWPQVIPLASVFDLVSRFGWTLF